MTGLRCLISVTGVTGLQCLISVTGVTGLQCLISVTGVTGLQCLISHDLCLTEDDLASLIASRREMLNAGRFRRLYPTASGNRYSGYLQELQALMLQDSKNIFQPVNSLFR